MNAKTIISAPAAWHVEPDRKAHYDRIHSVFESDGIQIDRFHNNPSYFRRDADGKPVPLQGSHPTLIHWPLARYVGGHALMATLTERIRDVEKIVSDGSIAWIAPSHWHSTVFTPVHSSDPDVIASANTDISEIVRRELTLTQPYDIVFTRLILTSDCGIKAAGYAVGSELDSLRERLRTAVPGGTASALVHISLGNFLRLPSSECLPSLKSFARQFLNDTVVLGRLKVDFLTYAIYTGPFIHMTVQPVFSEPLGKKPDQGWIAGKRSLGPSES